MMPRPTIRLAPLLLDGTARIPARPFVVLRRRLARRLVKRLRRWWER